MSVPHPFISRRTAVGGALAGLVAAAGCDDGPSSDKPTSGPTTAPAQDADTELVDRMIGRITATITVVAAARRQDPDLRVKLRPLAELHRSHLEALDFPEDTKIEHGSAISGVTQVRKAESTLQRHLTDAAVSAESGALAGLLASMAAAIAQHLAVLP